MDTYGRELTDTRMIWISQKNKILGGLIMNKKLIGMITSALVIGAASTALANPFADVPTDHWAYDAIDQLAADGVIEGYGDGTFAGDKAITRYEMAQIVARAMANCDGADAADKATIDKLTAEFSTELDALGVRVDNLEKKVAGIKNVQVYGDMRFRYDWKNANNAFDGGDDSAGPLKHRVRFGVKGDVNKDLAFNFRYMIQNHGEMGVESSINELADANLTWKNVFKNTNLTFGRYSQDLGISMYLLNSIGSVDGARLDYKAGKWHAQLGYADFGYASEGFNGAPNGKNIDQALYAQAKYQMTDDLKLQAMYFATQDEEPGIAGANTYSIGAEWQFAKNLYLLGEYVQNTDIDTDADYGSIVRLQYGKVSAAKPGSFALFVEKNDWNTGLLGDDTISANHGECMGKAIGESNWQIGFDMALAKNVVWQNWYAFDRTSQDAAKGDYEDFARTQINFSF